MPGLQKHWTIAYHLGMCTTYSNFQKNPGKASLRPEGRIPSCMLRLSGPHTQGVLFRTQAAQRTARRARAVMAACLPPKPQGGTRIAVIGDVHGEYDEHDPAAIAALQADVACIVGDFGEEVLDLVKVIANLPMPKAVILGNHDAWMHTKANLGKERSNQGLEPPSQEECRSFYQGVVDQLDVLGTDHVGFGAKHFPDNKLSVVGARPCSWGGKDWRQGCGICSDLYGVNSMAESAARIQHQICSQPEGSTIVVMGHNGPSGLGQMRHNICGVDWKGEEGDHGDPDLRSALDGAREQGLHVPLVLFGHMHHSLSRLRGRLPKQLRNMIHVSPESGMVCLNAAVVPRWREVGDIVQHHFTVADISQGVVTFAAHVWVEAARKGVGREFESVPFESVPPRIAEVEQLLEQLPAESSTQCVRRIYHAHTDEHVLVTSNLP